MTQELDQLYFDTFTAAMEDGGTNSWRHVKRYNIWQEDGSRNLAGFSVTVMDDEEDEEHFVTRETIVRGFQRIMKGTMGIHKDYINDVARAYRERDASDIDSYVADMILQAGIFGEVIYG